MIDATEILNEITPIFKDLFGDNSIKINLDTTANDIEFWTSLTHMQLIDAIENKFVISFTFDEVMTFFNVGDLVNCIVKKLIK
jgi:acyl carrier protein